MNRFIYSLNLETECDQVSYKRSRTSVQSDLEKTYVKVRIVNNERPTSNDVFCNLKRQDIRHVEARFVES